MQGGGGRVNHPYWMSEGREGGREGGGGWRMLLSEGCSALYDCVCLFVCVYARIDSQDAVRLKINSFFPSFFQ